MTSNDVVKPEANTKSGKKNKSILKTGSMLENIDINEQYLDETIHKNGS